LNLPDGSLATEMVAARRGIATALRRAPKPLLVVAPSLDDSHPDHRVVAACASASRQPGISWLTYPVWPAGIRLRGRKALLLSTQERLVKRHAIRSYRTQVGCIADDPGGFALTRDQVAAFSRPQETFVALRR